MPHSHALIIREEKEMERKREEGTDNASKMAAHDLERSRRTTSLETTLDDFFPFHRGDILLQLFWRY